MKVAVSTLTRFHAFDLAHQLKRHGCLERLYSGYPDWIMDEPLKSTASGFPWVLGLRHVAKRLGLHRLELELDWVARQTHDTWVSHRLRPVDVVVALSGFGLATFRRAKGLGALTVCDRGSSHISFQDEIRAEEHARWGAPYKPIERRIVEKECMEYEECDLITVPSTYAFRSFLAKGVSEHKIAKLSYGVDLRLFRPVEKEDNKFRVIFVGNLSLAKGVQYLLQAIEGLNLPNLEVCLIGTVSSEIKPLLAKYEGRFRYLGVIPQTELYRYYSQGSVFVLPSIDEGLALVQAQAMACGLPVIGTTHSGAEDLFSDVVEGFIIPIRSPEAIREKILYLYQNPDIRREMSRAALKRVAQMGGWDSYGDHAVELYGQRRRQRSNLNFG